MVNVRAYVVRAVFTGPKVDAIADAANESILGIDGVDGAIHQAVLKTRSDH